MNKASALEELQILCPPLNPVQKGKVDWDKLEKAVGFSYPTSFKNFISVYGSSIWFDTYYLLYTEARTQDEINSYRKQRQAQLDDIRFDMYDGETMEELDYAIGPSNPGLFPFINDFNGYTYLWVMSDDDPDQWSVLQWKMGPTIDLGPLSVAEMFLRWLKREEPMFSAWGDSEESDFAKRPLSR